MKRSSPRPTTRIRTSTPIVSQGQHGYELRCPFCSDHHLITPGVETMCGTTIEVTVSQEVYPVRTVRHQNLTCVKCFQGEGEMVRYGTSFIHLIDCKPEARLLQDVPEDNRIAKFVFGLPGWAKPFVEKYTGHADRVYEIDDTGKKTGKIIAHIFWKHSGKETRNDQSKPTNA